MFTNQNGHIEIYTNNTSQHILLQPGGGNVGIGIMNPSSLLHVNGTVTATAFSGSFYTYSDTSYIYSNGTPGDLTFVNGGGPTVRFQAGTGTIWCRGIHTEGGTIFSDNGEIDTGTGSITTAFIEVTSYKNKTTPNGFYQYFFNSNTNQVGYQSVNASGTCSIYSHQRIFASNFISFSDRRIKKNITKVSNCLNIINKINIVSYNYIDPFKGNYDAYGVIAQDIYNIIPSAINKSKDIVPNIMKPALSISHIDDYICINIKTNIDENDDIKIGSILILYVNNSSNKEVQLKTKILYINYNDGIIHVEKWDNYNEIDKVFIYGTEVDNYLSVNKSTLGILALQGVKELSEIIDKQEEKIAAQQSQLDKLLQWAITQGYSP
jgi:hypothetical protein